MRITQVYHEAYSWNHIVSLQEMEGPIKCPEMHADLGIWASGFLFFQQTVSGHLSAFSVLAQGYHLVSCHDSVWSAHRHQALQGFSQSLPEVLTEAGGAVRWADAGTQSPTPQRHLSSLFPSRTSSLFPWQPGGHAYDVLQKSPHFLSNLQGPSIWDYLMTEKRQVST